MVFERGQYEGEYVRGTLGRRRFLSTVGAVSIGSPSDGAGAGSGDDGADGSLSRCASESAAASDLRGQFTTIGNLIISLIAAVAVPNGAYGLFEWMTAGSNVRQGRKGKKRVRNTFVALAGVAVLKVAVNLTTAVLCV